MLLAPLERSTGRIEHPQLAQGDPSLNHQVRVSRGVAPVEVAATAKEEAVEVAKAAHEVACKQLAELVADYLDDALSPEMRARFEEHLAGCDGCTAYLSQTQRIIVGLRGLFGRARRCQASQRGSTG